VAGRTSLNHAFAGGHSELVTYLKNMGATMRQDGTSRGFVPDMPLPEYNPADEPELDLRNPRFTGTTVV